MVMLKEIERGSGVRDPEAGAQAILAQAMAWRELRKIVSIIYTSGVDAVSARTFCCLMDQLHDESESEG